MAQPSTRASYKPKLLISVHGIRTRGAWQKDIFPVFGNSVTKIESFDYGNYGLFKFLRPPVNRKMVDAFYKWYGEKVEAARGVDLGRFDKRPSCVAHSFGTWIVGMAMLKYEDIKFDKIVFSGSVLPGDFDWDRLIARDQVGSVYNECGGKDFWPRVASALVSGTGDAGSRGFGRSDSVVTDHPRPHFRHPDPLYRQHMLTAWKPFILTRPSPLYTMAGRSVPTSEQFTATLAHCRKIDQQIYGIAPSYQSLALPADRSKTWIAINPDIYTFLMDKGTGLPGGYVNAMPVTDAAYEKLRKGELRDMDVMADDIEPFSPSSTVKMYLMSVAILEEYRIWGQGLLHRGYVQLSAATVETLIHYAQTGNVRISHFLAVTWTPEGKKLCRLLGMTKVGEDQDKHDIYELEIAPLVQGKVEAARSLSRLIEVYRAM